MSWRRFLRRAAWDAERRAELDAHLAHETDDNLARGMSPEQARAAAHRKLGNATLIREEIYGMNTIAWLEGLWQDVRYAARVLGRSRAFAVVAIVSLTLGVGANTAIFGLIEAIRLRPLPVAQPQTLVALDIDTHGHGRSGEFVGRFGRMTNPMWERLREETGLLVQPFAFGGQRLDLSEGGESQPIEGIAVSGGFFEALGTVPAAGRLIGHADDHRGCSTPVAVLSHAFWQRRFGGDPAVIGRAIRLYGVPVSISGVTEPRFMGLDAGRNFEIAVPICAEALIRAERSRLDRSDSWWLVVMARRPPGLTVDEFSARIGARSAAIFNETVPPAFTTTDRANYLSYTLTAESAGTGLSSLRTQYAESLWLLLGIAGAVLVIACGNLANLMLARARAREREIAVRLAIGASRSRVMRQLIVESLVLSAVGAALGAVLADVLARGLVGLIETPGTSYFVDVEFNWRILGFVGALAVITSALFGVLPALKAAFARPGAVIASAGRSTSDRRERVVARRLLVVGQVAVSLVLLVGALLFVVTLRNLNLADAGMRTSDVTVASFDLRRAAVPPDRREEFRRRFFERLAGLPGVEAASPVFVVPMNGNTWNDVVVIDGKPREPYPYLNRVGPAFFNVLEIPLVAGRAFTEADTPSTPPVAVVNEAFGRAFFNTAAPLGREFRFDVGPGVPNPMYRIVGVVKDTKYAQARDGLGPLAYFADTQAPGRPFAFEVVLRSQPGLALAPAVLAATREMDPRILASIRTMDSQIAGSLVRERLMATLSSFFGILGGVLAAVGLYGVMSYLVVRRRFEIGLRMALGADFRRVVSMMLKESAALVAIGLVAGLGLAVATTRWAATLLFDLSPTDPRLLAAAVAGLALVALGASLVPAVRAARIDPTSALRSE
jgi:predicted permease